MELTRRDALIALGSGLSISAFIAGRKIKEKNNIDIKKIDGFTEHKQETLIAIAKIVYPTSLSGINEFVKTYSIGKMSNRPEYRTSIINSINLIDRLSEEWYDKKYINLDKKNQESVLREIGSDTAEPKKSGSPAERIRYYIINELLYALYTTPKGGRLVGIENPQGYPGGLETYQKNYNK